MTQTERSILQALIELENAVRPVAARQAKPDLQPLFARLDDLTSRLPKDAASDLLHYLHHKSYQKARLWLEGRDSENAHGACRRAS